MYVWLLVRNMVRLRWRDVNKAKIKLFRATAAQHMPSDILFADHMLMYICIYEHLHIWLRVFVVDIQ